VLSFNVLSCVSLMVFLYMLYGTINCVVNRCRDLPRISILTISIYREADKKKKKDQHTLLGECTLSISGTYL